MVGKDKEGEIEVRMEALNIKKDDLIEKFILGSGKGGQKINKTSSCVYLKHVPTGIEIKCQRSRSREENRFLARRELCDRLQKQITGEKSKKEQLFEKTRRQKRRRSRRMQQKVLEGKRQSSEKKALRKPPKDLY